MRGGYLCFVRACAELGLLPCRFTDLDEYEIFLEVRRKNGQLTPVPEHVAFLDALYKRAEDSHFGRFAAQRPALLARLAAVAEARGDTGAQVATAAVQ